MKQTIHLPLHLRFSVCGLMSILASMTPACVTVRSIVVSWVNDSLAPWIVSVKLPSSAVELADTVNVDVTVPSMGGVTEVGISVAVTPVGAPVTDRPTSALNPLIDVIVMVEVPELPCTIVSEEGDTETENYGTMGIRVKLTVVVSLAVTVAGFEALV